MRWWRWPRSMAARGEHGFAIVVVLWLIVLMSLQVSLMNLDLGDGIHLVENEAALARGQVLVLAGFELAAGRMLSLDERQRWIADGETHVVRYDGVDLLVTLSDENGRINLNTADPALLQGLFTVATGSAGEAATLTDRVLDWRDPDHERRTRGAEDGDYRRAGLGHGAADAPFLDASDLTRVLGMTPELADRVLPNVTVYTQDGRVNASLASEDVLRSLPDIGRETISEVLRLRRRGGDGIGKIEELLAPAARFLRRERGPAIRVRVETRGDRRGVLGWGEAIILLVVDKAAPYRMLAWRNRSGVGGGTVSTAP